MSAAETITDPTRIQATAGERGGKSRFSKFVSR